MLNVYMRQTFEVTVTAVGYLHQLFAKSVLLSVCLSTSVYDTINNDITSALSISKSTINARVDTDVKQTCVISYAIISNTSGSFTFPSIISVYTTGCF